MVEMGGCVRRDIHKVGVVGEWRELAEDRGRWRSIVVKAGKNIGAIASLTPYKGKRRRRNGSFCNMVMK